MHRNVTYLIALSLALAACGRGAATPTPTIAPRPAATPTAAPAPAASTATSPTTVAQVATPAAPSQPSSFKLDPATACKPAGKPQAVPGISPVGPEDWIKGSPDAPVTLMEYADYQ
jgi:hypothetical protein